MSANQSHWQIDSVVESPDYTLDIPMGDTICKVYADSEQGKDNARLIQQAPALLAELEKIKNQLSHLFYNGQIMANAPERERIRIYILDAEYLIGKIRGES